MFKYFPNIQNKKQAKTVLPAITLACFVVVLALAVINIDINYLQAAGESGADSALKGLNQTANKAYTGQNDPGTDVDDSIITDIPSMIGRIVGMVLSFIGVVFLILMIYGGITWMLARGNEQQVAKAKDLIIAAIIGLIIVMAAYAITAYVGGAIIPGS